MKGKNSTRNQEPRSFALEESFLSCKDHIIIALIALLIEICHKSLLILLEFKWSLTASQDSTLLAFFILREVLMLCVLVLMPVLWGLCLILTHWLKKQIQQLDEVLRQQGQIMGRKNNNDREKTSPFFIAFLCFIVLFTLSFSAGIMMLILEFYYFVFKRIRLYCRVKRALKHVRQKPNRAFAP
ncbi:hypothetical protein [Bartonella massiliensis]|uniref:hypothetical protein n=1 Tax=Bartonella massiliensis TaxID=929795 RepID=UPI00115C1DBF|nr:hypothetical protein [Bartonella massiliensis]